MKLSPGGATALYLDPRCSSTPDFKTTVKVASGRFSMSAVPVCATTGVYRVAVGGRALTLRLVTDPCSPRITLLVGTWKHA